MSGLIDDVARIVVVRANGLGDFVFALPALHALRQAYPSAEITLVGRRHHLELLSGRPSPIDDVEVAPPFGGVTAPDEAGQTGPDIERFFRRWRTDASTSRCSCTAEGRTRTCSPVSWARG